MLAKFYRAFRLRFPRISAARALFVARSAAALPEADRKQTLTFNFPDATEAERGALFRDNVRKAYVTWKPTEYSPAGHSLADASKFGAYNPKCDTSNKEPGTVRGGSHVRWIENDKAAGLRLVGFADEIAREAGSRSVAHTGWFADSFQDKLFRGIVYRLPSRNGKPVFVYGYADPDNDGAALLCFDNDRDTPLEAARAADQFAEWNAESEREYNARETAANDIAEAKERIKATRDELRAITAELKACRKRCKNWRKSKRYSALLGAVRNEMARLRASIETEKETISEREDNYWSAVE